MSNPQLLDTIAAMTLNGFAFYAIAAAFRKRGTALMGGPPACCLPEVHSPSSSPLAILVRTGDIPRAATGFIWGRHPASLLSQRRQRKSFYYAGLLNTGAALFLIADHREWFGRPTWG